MNTEINTIFCLISRQAMANVIPVFMFKPDNVILFATPEEKKTANHLQKLFESKNIRVDRVDDLDAYDYLNFKKCIYQKLESTNDEVWLNVTGGTKLMALAAYEAFAEKNKKIIYCNTDRNQIIHLFPRLFTEKFNLDLSIDDYLKSHGYDLISAKTSFVKNEFFDLFSLLESQNLLTKFSDFLDKYRSETGSENPVKTYIVKSNKIFKIQKTTSNVVLFVNQTTFKYDDDKFLKGDWLEYFMLYSLKKQRIIPQVGVKIISETNVENEIDIVFIKDYQLYLISCKSGKNSDSNKDIYEIETLRNIAGGTYGRAFLFTAKDLTPRIKQRAVDLKVTTLTLNKITHNEFTFEQKTTHEN